MNTLKIIYLLIFQFQLFNCHTDQTLCGSFLSVYSDCVDLTALTFKVNSTLENETKFMCGVISSIKNCYEQQAYIDLVTNDVLNCTCLIANFNQTSSEYRFYKSLSNVCSNTDLYSQISDLLSNSNLMFPKNTSYDYSKETNNTIKFDLYCKNYGWYDWHTSLIHQSFCIGLTGNISIYNCWDTYGKYLRSNHTNEDRRAIASNLIKCYLQEAADNCPIEMKKILTIFGIIDTEIVSGDYKMKLSIDEFFQPVDIKSCKRSIVGMFGDPHVIPFNLNYQGPCNFLGNMVCLKNDFLQINCISSDMAGLIVLSAIQIQFFYNSTPIAVYSANNGSLPSSFTNGQALILNSNKESSVFIIFKSSNILIVDIQSNSFIQIGVYQSAYSLLVRTSDDLLINSYGLLISNCLTSYNVSKVLDNRTCSLLLNDTHFTGVLSNWKPMFINICNYDVNKYQNQSFHRIIHQYVHFISDSISSDDTMIKDPIKLYLTTTTISPTGYTVNEAEVSIHLCYLTFILNTFVALAFL